MTYRVTAEDGTTEDYTVSVQSTSKSITSFSFTQALNSNLSASQVDGVIDETGKTITLKVNGNALPNLIATFSISAGAKLEVAGTLQESGVTTNDFSNPVTYRVTAEDGTTEDYTVSVTAKSTEKSIKIDYLHQKAPRKASHRFPLHRRSIPIFPLPRLMVLSMKPVKPSFSRSKVTPYPI